MYQLIIKNGTVMDPADNFWGKADVAVSDGKIAAMGNDIRGEAAMTVDAAGCMVTPGLIDHHAHLYPLADIGIPAEAVCFASGVTTVVDAGSTGCETYRQHRSFLEDSKLTIKAYLNVCSTGLDSLPCQMEDVTPDKIDFGAIKEVFQEYGPDLCGLKLRTSKEIVGGQGYRPLQKTVELAERLGVRVMIHCTNPPGTMGELLRYLRKGDIVTHMYMNKGDTILGAQCIVCKEVLEARKRGVLFEAADARAHFSFSVSEASMKEKFYPDVIATDLTKFSMHLRPTAFNMANQLGKYHWLGMPLERVLACCTSIPAKIIGQERKIGCLAVGANADIAVFRKTYHESTWGDRPYLDPECQLRKGDILFDPQLTVKNGEIVFRSMLF